MNTESNPEVFLLFSGGIDSTTCIAYYIMNNYDVSLLFIDYGQPDSNLERKSTIAVADYYNLSLKTIRVDSATFSEGYIPGRNSMLLSLALMSCPFNKGLVSIGVHSGTFYSDCSPEFIALMQKIFSLYEDGRLKIDAPFLHWKKSQIIDFAETVDAPLHLAHSTNPRELPVKFQLNPI